MNMSQYPYTHELDPIKRTASWTLNHATPPFTDEELKIINNDLRDDKTTGLVATFEVTERRISIQWLKPEGCAYTMGLIVEILQDRRR
ncbi:MAG TPA: hypothetical protein VD907_03840 [Verrucomicrobiae bacterium]|nr:hypothetical protein [Verrucomicrobiae bacterium]